MDFTNEKEALKKAMHDFADSYRNHKANEMRKAQERVKPGEKLSAALGDGVFFDVAEKAAFTEEAAVFAQRARDAVAAMRTKVNAEKAAAPGADAAAVIAVMQGRSNVTREEIDAMIETYGSNYLVYNALRDVANKNGFKHLYDESILDVFTKDVEGLERSVNKTFNVHSAESGHASPGFVAVFDMTVDNAFTE